MLKTTYSLPEIIHATKSNIVYYEYQPLAKYKHVYVFILFTTTNICCCILIKEERLYTKIHECHL